MYGGPPPRLRCVFNVAADKENNSAASFSVRYSFRAYPLHLANYLHDRREDFLQGVSNGPFKVDLLIGFRNAPPQQYGRY